MPVKQVEPIHGQPGKLKVKKDPRTLDLSKYIDRAQFPKIPAKHNLIKKMRHPLRMMKNSKLNDCTCAAAAHMVACWTAHSTAEKRISDQAILHTYSALSQYDPVTGKNNNGVAALDVLNYWRKNGIARHKILAFASMGHKDRDMLREAIYLFGGIYVGLQLPKSIKGQKIWDVPAEGLKGQGKKGSFGGHAVCVLAYDEDGLTCISWGLAKKMTWAFWEAYSDEVYALISKDFFKGRKTPDGLSVHAIEADLLNVTKEKVTLAKQLQGKQYDTPPGITTDKQNPTPKKSAMEKKVLSGRPGGKGG